MALSRTEAGHRLWLRLFFAERVGGVACARLLEKFKTVEAIFAAGEEAFRDPPELARTYLAIHRSGLDAKVDRLEEEVSRVPGARIVTPSAEEYPKRLLSTGAVPAALFVRGLLRNQLPSVAVVGSRRPQTDRAKLTREWCAQLARAGASVVSGLAVGIDAAAHEGTLRGQGHTVAVLGTGLARTYPSHHVPLQDRILATGGAVISQFSPRAAMSWW
jgi:DNA processing protein